MLQVHYLSNHLLATRLIESGRVDLHASAGNGPPDRFVLVSSEAHRSSPDVPETDLFGTRRLLLAVLAALVMLSMGSCSPNTRTITLEWLPAGRVTVDTSVPTAPYGSYRALSWDEDWWAKVGIIKETDTSVDDLEWISLDSESFDGLTATISTSHKGATHVVAYLWATKTGHRASPSTLRSPSQDYDYRVRAINREGDSPWSDPVRVRTPRIAFAFAFDGGTFHSMPSIELKLDSLDHPHVL